MNAKEILMQAMVEVGLEEYIGKLPDASYFAEMTEKGEENPKKILFESFGWMSDTSECSSFWRGIYDRLPDKISSPPGGGEEITAKPVKEGVAACGWGSSRQDTKFFSEIVSKTLRWGVETAAEQAEINRYKSLYKYVDEEAPRSEISEFDGGQAQDITVQLNQYASGYRYVDKAAEGAARKVEAGSKTPECGRGEIMIMAELDEGSGCSSVQTIKIKDFEANKDMIERNCAALTASVSESVERSAPTRLSPWDHYPDMEPKVSPLWGARLEQSTDSC